MGYKPTLGGLKKAQEFLAFKGYPLPVFQTDIYEHGEWLYIRFVPGKGQAASIDEAIRKQGSMREVVDVRLTTERGDRALVFSDIKYVGRADIYELGGRYDALMEFDASGSDPSFERFMKSENGGVIENLARWGKETVTWFDRIKFHFFPRRYARKVFA